MARVTAVAFLEKSEPLMRWFNVFVPQGGGVAFWRRSVFLLDLFSNGNYDYSNRPEVAILFTVFCSNNTQKEKVESFYRVFFL